MDWAMDLRWTQSCASASQVLKQLQDLRGLQNVVAFLTRQREIKADREGIKFSIGEATAKPRSRGPHPRTPA